MHSWRTRRGALLLLLFLFVVDATCSVLLAFSAHHWNFSEVKDAFPEGLTSFSRDCLDGVLIVLARLILLVALGRAAVHWGTPIHERQLEARKNAVRQREELRARWRAKRGLPPLLLERADEEGGRADTADAPMSAAAKSGLMRRPFRGGASEEHRQPLLSLQDKAADAVISSHSDPLLLRTESWNVNGAGSTASAATGDPDEDALSFAFERSLPPLPPVVDLTDSEKLVFSRRATRIRRIFVCIIFTVAALMQVYAGLKIIGFSFSAPWTQGLLMATVIVVINAEQSVLRLIIDHLSKEQGYLFLELHPHRIYYGKCTFADKLTAQHFGRAPC